MTTLRTLEKQLLAMNDVPHRLVSACDTLSMPSGQAFDYVPLRFTSPRRRSTESTLGGASNTDVCVEVLHDVAMVE